MSNRWDQYWLSMCETVSSNGVCPARQLGAVIIRGHSIVSTGYNSPPAGFPHPGTRKFVNLATDCTPELGGLFPAIVKRCPRKMLDIPSGAWMWKASRRGIITRRHYTMTSDDHSP